MRSACHTYLLSRVNELVYRHLDHKTLVSEHRSTVLSVPPSTFAMQTILLLLNNSFKPIKKVTQRWGRIYLAVTLRSACAGLAPRANIDLRFTALAHASLLQQNEYYFELLLLSTLLIKSSARINEFVENYASIFIFFYCKCNNCLWLLYFRRARFGDKKNLATMLLSTKLRPHCLLALMSVACFHFSCQQVWIPWLYIALCYHGYVVMKDCAREFKSVNFAADPNRTQTSGLRAGHDLSCLLRLIEEIRTVHKFRCWYIDIQNLFCNNVLT
jgi:hypothetical protein